MHIRLSDFDKRHSGYDERQAAREAKRAAQQLRYQQPGFSGYRPNQPPRRPRQYRAN